MDELPKGFHAPMSTLRGNPFPQVFPLKNNICLWHIPCFYCKCIVLCCFKCYLSSLHSFHQIALNIPPVSFMLEEKHPHLNVTSLSLNDLRAFVDLHLRLNRIPMCIIK